MNDQLTITKLVEKLELLEHIEEAKNRRISRICLDDESIFDDAETRALEDELNEMYPENTFEIVPVFSGYALDLLITNKNAQAKYDSIPKTKSYRDLYRQLYEEHGIQSSGAFSGGLNEKITDEEFDSLLNFHIDLSKMTADSFKTDNEVN